MADTTPLPRYSLWQGISAAVALATRALEEVRSLARLPGPRGPDGLGFDDMAFEKVDDRNFVLKFQRGEEKVAFPFSMPAMIYRGTWKEGDGYQQGDCVTWGGHLWHCDFDTNEKPLEHSNIKGAWTLCAKRGRDGKNGRDGKDGERGLNGKDAPRF